MKFEAMYYPFVSVRNQETLKQMLLYFDKIHVLNPGDFTISNDKVELWHTYNLDYINELSRKDIISTIHPRQILRKHKSEFINSVEEDLKDEYFSNFKEKKEWLLYNQKMPRAIKEKLRDKIIEKEKFPTILKVNRDLSESVLINHAIYSCMDYNLTPITDVETHSQTLNHKIRRNYEINKDFLYENGYVEDLKQNILASKAINRRLPGLEGIGESDILDFRDDNKDELRRFRIMMGRLASKVESEPFTPNFSAEVERIIHSDIDPLVIEIENEMQEFKDEMAVRYIKKTIPLAISFSAIAAVGLPLSIAALGGLTVGSIGRGIDRENVGVFESILDDWKRWRKKNRNSLNYLLKVERMPLN